ncbi:RNA-directed DNA polymerase, eukaryota [Tanacetum coccineum]
MSRVIKYAHVSASFRRPVRGGIEQQLSHIPVSHNRWVCSISGDGSFSVKDIRNSLDDLFLPSWPEPTRWVKSIPIKINVFTWRARRDCLPTRSNLIRRGISLDSDNCPICCSTGEDASHVFFQCELAQAVMRYICRWWDLEWQQWSSFSEWNQWFSNLRITFNSKSLLEGVFSVAWWSIWLFRNRLLFGDKPPSRSTIIDDIVSSSFLWIKNRCKWVFTWEAWLKNPHLISL